ncbi:hypothetical protein B0T10DRAFT_538474 [Thelonectria olida]|uniref:Zn(2)-C6 fungal-type domain-containing protein n=1 Tax=Thelonectria olida TaxID=1576542 RepID=A0A9P9APC4_9HYPO|nr:hypothetical protein B0T10DRAFT_538474 [Thelonectria olida]
MPLGPFDRRKKRTRCRHCASSHLKCSGNRPCSHCEKRAIFCVYPDPGEINRPIEIDRGSQKTIASYARQNVANSKLTRAPKVDATYFYFYYFDLFLQNNNFGQHGVFAIDTKDMARSVDAAGFLKDAILSLGAMAAVRLKSTDGPTRPENYRFALTSYTHSVAGLRTALENNAEKSQLRLNVMWTTLILGLFELMTDSSGQGWIQHLVHGTSKALIASGPAACRFGPGQRFFTEVKIFEVCRSVVFNEPSFLTQAEWAHLSMDLQSKTEGKKPHSLDALLHITVRCSSLLVRAKNFIGTADGSTPELDTSLAHELAMEGFCEREALRTWSERNSELLRGSPESDASSQSQEYDFASLAMIFHAATSVYLSGVFDYDIVHWNDLGTLVSTLNEDEIQMYLGTILGMSQLVLNQAKISPLLLLFPLRVAGARSRERWQQDMIINLLARIEGTFSVAGAFVHDLQGLWSVRGWS